MSSICLMFLITLLPCTISKQLRDSCDRRGKGVYVCMKYSVHDELEGALAVSRMDFRREFQRVDVRDLTNEDDIITIIIPSCSLFSRIIGITKNMIIKDRTGDCTNVSMQFVSFFQTFR